MILARTSGCAGRVHGTASAVDVVQFAWKVMLDIPIGSHNFGVTFFGVDEAKGRLEMFSPTKAGKKIVHFCVIKYI